MLEGEVKRQTLCMSENLEGNEKGEKRVIEKGKHGKAHVMSKTLK